MIGSKISPIGTLRLLLFETLKEPVSQEETEETEEFYAEPVCDSFECKRSANDRLEDLSNWHPSFASVQNPKRTSFKGGNRGN